MQRVLNIFGQPATFVDSDESQYLPGVPADYERDTLSTFAALCGPHFNVLDVGANIGLTAVALGRLCSQGSVIAIEPSPNTFDYLTANIAKSGLAHVTCENMAASATSGSLSYTFVPSHSTGGFISEKYQLTGAGYRHCTVPARALDEYLQSKGSPRIDFIKLDVEGFEMEVLRGARQTVERSKPTIYCEVNHWCLNIFRRLSLPDFIEELFTFCPHVFAIHSDLHFLDLSDPGERHRFYHDHTIHFEYVNLVCGFDKAALLAKLNFLSTSYSTELERQSMLHMVQQERDALRRERDAMLNSRSWRLTAPLRRLSALKRRIRPAA